MVVLDSYIMPRIMVHKFSLFRIPRSKASSNTLQSKGAIVLVYWNFVMAGIPLTIDTLLSLFSPLLLCESGTSSWIKIQSFGMWLKNHCLFMVL